jgi:hypothetical protein
MNLLRGLEKERAMLLHRLETRGDGLDLHDILSDIQDSLVVIIGVPAVSG